MKRPGGSRARGACTQTIAQRDLSFVALSIADCFGYVAAVTEHGSYAKAKTDDDTVPPGNVHRERKRRNDEIPESEDESPISRRQQQQEREE
eukprot:gene17726-21177_t